MALETARVAVDDTAYVQVGDNVTALTMTEKLVGDMRCVVVPNAATAPLVDETNYIEWDSKLQFSGTAADVFVRTNEGSTFVGVIRE